MTETFDLIVRNGTVVNHDGAGVRDIRVQTPAPIMLDHAGARRGRARSSAQLAASLCGSTGR